MTIGLLSPLIVGAGLALSACHGMSNDSMAQKSLYDRLGGQPSIVAVVDDFVANVAADPKINGRFAKTDIPKLKQNLVDQICAASGGPCTYKGKDMAAAHAGMNISKDEFNAMGADMAKTLDKFQVPDKEKHEVLSLLGSMQGDVVGH
jgi:hemoglobin